MLDCATANSNFNNLFSKPHKPFQIVSPEKRQSFKVAHFHQQRFHSINLQFEIASRRNVLMIMRDWSETFSDLLDIRYGAGYTHDWNGWTELQRGRIWWIFHFQLTMKRTIAIFCTVFWIFWKRLRDGNNTWIIAQRFSALFWWWHCRFTIVNCCSAVRF